LGKTPQENAYNFLKVEGVHGPQNTLMLRRCIIAGMKERFEGHTLGAALIAILEKKSPKIKFEVWKL
jgi:hypothetical protein